MSRFRITIAQRGIHTHLTVFAGPPGAGANCGTLVMRPHEADAFLAACQAGSVGPEGSGADVEVGIAERPSPMEE